MSLSLVIFAVILLAVNGQRSPYAGSRPGAGYKDRYVPQTSQSTDSNNRDVEDRLGANSGTQSGGTTLDSTTQRLPFDAYGDKFIVDHYNSLPVDQRPFWILNQQQIEAHRGTPSQLSNSNTNAGTNSGTNIVDRFNDNSNNNSNNVQRPANQNQLQYNPNAVSQQEIIYPDNLTTDQRLEMEINVQRDRLAALERRRQQLAAGGNQQNQNQPQSQSSQQNQQSQQNNQQLNQLQQQQQSQNVQRVERAFVPPQNSFRRLNSQFVAPYFSEYDF